MACGKCGAAGHNSTTCKATAGRASVMRSRSASPPALAPVLDPNSPVAAQLEARLARLKREVEIIERLLPELRELEAGS